MPTIVPDPPYVTLINLFRVAPEHQLGLARVQLGDMYWYGNQQPGNLSASFHRSDDGVRVFNYGQWTSPDVLGSARESADFQRHIANMRFFDYTISPTLYEVPYTTSAAPIRLSYRDGLATVLTVAEVAAERQQELLDHYREALEELASSAPSGFVAAALHRAVDGRTVAEYSQWRSPADYAAARDEAPYKGLQDRLDQLAGDVDSHVYELFGSSDD